MTALKTSRWLELMIGIAVGGLSGEYYFRFMARLQELLPQVIEVIELENCRFDDKIVKTGMKIK
mgnify:CR=1 FL=1